MKNELIFSLGSNIEPRLKFLNQAIKILNVYFSFIKVSSLYESKPVIYEKQDLFYNICAEYKTDIHDPFKVLEIIKEVEKQIGRKKTFNKGPREIDIDIIFFGECSIKTEILTIPHEHALNRKFVLEPLLEILPKKSEYIKKYDLINVNDKLKDQEITKIGEFKLGK